MIHGEKKKKKKRGGTIKNEETPRSIPHCYERMRPRIDSLYDAYSACDSDHADAGVLSKFHWKHSGKRVTRAGLSSNRIKAIVRVAAACGLKINGTK